MMRTCRIALSILMALAARDAFAQKVIVDWDKTVDFSKFKTYAWIESKHPAEGLWAQRVVDGIDRQLTAKGLKKVDRSASPDLEVVYNSGVKERTIIVGYDYGYIYQDAYGPLWARGPRNRSHAMYVEKEGNLVVDLVDASKKDMVWRGVARDSLSDKTKKNERKLNKAIEKMFKRYPVKK
jgi:hypothetical protein